MEIKTVILCGGGVQCLLEEYMPRVIRLYAKCYFSIFNNRERRKNPTGKGRKMWLKLINRKDYEPSKHHVDLKKKTRTPHFLPTKVSRNPSSIEAQDLSTNEIVVIANNHLYVPYYRHIAIQSNDYEHHVSKLGKDQHRKLTQLYQTKFLTKWTRYTSLYNKTLEV